jgi:Invasin, domain 3
MACTTPGGRILTHVSTARRRLRVFGASLALATVAVFGATAVVSAYTPPGSVLSVTQGCSSVQPGGSCQVQFQLKDANGNPVCDATVTFSTSGVTGSTVSPASATTNCNTGDVLATFTAGSGCGTATVTASSPPASAQTTINVPCPVATLPNTSTLPPSTPMWLPGLVAIALLTVIGGGLALRRMRLTS